MSSLIGNCYELVSRVRRAVNDYSTGKVNGTDTSGAFLNEQIIEAINDAQKFIFDLIFVRLPHLFLTSATITGSASVYALPSDFFKLRRVEDSQKLKVSLISVDGRHLSDNTGSKYLYYRYGSNLRIDYDGFSDNLTLHYYKRPRLLNMGQVQTGGPLSLTLAATARKEADYYKNMQIEDITADWFATISAYSAARVATVAQTAGTADYYGVVSELPEELHHLIGRRASLYMKSDPRSPVPLGPGEAGQFKEDFVESLRSLTGKEIGDVSIDDIVLGLEPLI